MLSTLFTKKNKSTSAKKLILDNKQHFFNLERLLAELGIKFSKNSASNKLALEQEKKVQDPVNTDRLQSDLQKIEMNQIAYSKLLKEKMYCSQIAKKKDKIVLMRS